MLFKLFGICFQAHEKEQRYLHRQQRRAELELKKKEREEEKARLKAEKERKKAESEKSLDDTKTSPRRISLITASLRYLCSMPKMVKRFRRLW